MSTQASRADSALADAMNTAAADPARVTYAAKLRKISHRAPASIAIGGRTLGGDLEIAGAVVGQSLGLVADRTPLRIASEESLDYAAHRPSLARRKRAQSG